MQSGIDNTVFTSNGTDNLAIQILKSVMLQTLEKALKLDLQKLLNKEK